MCGQRAWLHHLGRHLADATGASTDRAGRVVVEPDLTLPGHPEISVIGDLVAAKSHAPGHEPTPVPGIVARRQADGPRHGGQHPALRLAGQPTQPFRYRDYGNLATIGRNSAVVDLTSPAGPVRFSGYFAWLFWLFARVLLIGFRNRLVGAAGLGLGVLELARYARVVTGIERHEATPHPFPARL